MTGMNRARTLASTLLLLTLSACDLFTPELHLVVQNAMSADVDNVTVSFAGHQLTMGAVPAGAHASYGPIVADVPDDAFVTWSTTDGRRHTQRVSVKSHAQNRSGDIVLTIVAADRVEVTFKR